MIIDSALKTYYNSDIAIMIQAIQRNITVRFSFFLLFMFLGRAVAYTGGALQTLGWFSHKVDKCLDIK